MSENQGWGEHFQRAPVFLTNVRTAEGFSHKMKKSTRNHWFNTFAIFDQDNVTTVKMLLH